MAVSEDTQKLRRLYGRGFCDGLRAVGVEPEEFMNYAKLQAAETRMADLAKSLRSIAAEAEEIALDMEARANQLHNDTAKLRQLQELLKGLGA